MPKTIVGLKSLIMLIKTKPHLMHYSLYNLKSPQKLKNFQSTLYMLLASMSAINNLEIWNLLETAS